MNIVSKEQTMGTSETHLSEALWTHDYRTHTTFIAIRTMRGKNVWQLGKTSIISGEPTDDEILRAHSKLEESVIEHLLNNAQLTAET